VRLKKGFWHLGRLLNAGDEFVGDAEQIADIIAQGFADDPDKIPQPPRPQ
jgi:hypothetical protein